MIVKKYIGVQYDVLSCKDVQKYHEISHILNFVVILKLTVYSS